MAVDLTPDAIDARFREVCRLMAEPVVVPDVDAITPEQVEERLAEVCALWAMCLDLSRARA